MKRQTIHVCLTATKSRLYLGPLANISIEFFATRYGRLGLEMVFVGLKGKYLCEAVTWMHWAYLDQTE